MKISRALRPWREKIFDFRHPPGHLKFLSLGQNRLVQRYLGMETSTILVPVDFSDVTQQVVAMANRMASAFKSKVVMLHISESGPTRSRRWR